MKRSFLVLRPVMALFALFALRTGAPAQNINWSEGAAPNIKWSAPMNWTGGVVPGPTNTATLVQSGTSASSTAGADNIVDVDIQVRALLYRQTNNQWHNTVINPGVTLTLLDTNTTIMLDSGSLSDPAGGLTHCYNTISGAGGALVVSNTNAASIINVEQGSATYAGAVDQWAILDMSGLDSFNATVGRLFVGVEGVGPTAGQVNLFNNSRATGVLWLAKTNIINLTQVGNIQGTGNAAAAGPALVLLDTYENFDDFSSYLYLGQSNAISADTITIGRHEAYHTAVFEFNPNFTAPTLYLRGASSNRVSEFVVADNTINGNTGNAGVAPGAGIGNPTAAQNPGAANAGCAGLVDLSQGTSDMMIDTLYVGKGHNATGGGYTEAVFKMGAGTLDVNTLQLGVMSAAAGTTPVLGTLTVKSGHVLVNSNNLALGVKLGTSRGAVAAGYLTLTDGATLNVANGLYGIIDSGQSASAVTIANSTVTAANIGSAAAPIGSMTLGDSTLNIAVSGLTGAIVADNLTTDSDTNAVIINVSSISQLAGVSSVITLVSSGNAIGGNGAADFRLGALPAGFVGTLQTTASSIQLALTQSPYLPINWTGADLANSANWSDGLNWSTHAEPGPGNPAVFNNTGSVTSPSKTSNIVDGNITVFELTYANTGGTYQNTSIATNEALTVTLGGLTVGSAVLDLGNTTGNVTVSGRGGALNVTNGSVYVGLGHSDPSSTAKATLDMSGLGTFNATVPNFLVGVGAVGPTTVLQPAGTVYLAQTNTIVASSGTGSGDSSLVALDVGDAGDAETTAGYGNNVPSSLYLGQTNTIFADYISVGRQWASGGIFFNPALTNANPAVYIGGVSSGMVASWNIGDGAANALTSGAGAGTNDFTGGTVNASVDTLQIGKASPNSLNIAAPVTGTLTFSAGTITANTVNLSFNPAYSDGNVYNYAVGTLNVNGTGTLIVNDTLNLAFAGGPVLGAPLATLNINGGSVFANNVLPSTQPASSPAAAGGGTSIISITGGSLTVTNGIGTAAVPLTSLNLTNATINVSPTAFTPSYIYAQNVSASGTNTINLLSLPPVESYPATVTILQSAGAIVGGAANFRVGAPAGFVVQKVTESADSMSILATFSSGPIVPRGNVFWNGPDVANANNINWSDGANWLLPPTPASYDTAFFDNTGESISATAGPDNIVDADVTVGGLWYAATNGSAYGNEVYAHNTLINPGVTLTVFNTNVSIMLACGTDTDTGGYGTCYNTISGPGGTLIINNTNAESSIYVSEGSSTYQAGQSDLYASLDMSGLDTFDATVGRFLIGIQGNGPTPGQPTYVNAGREDGIVYLAKTNVINLTQAGNIQGTGYAATAGPALVLNDLAGFGDYGDYLYLGQANAIYADTITIGREQCSRTAVFQFNPDFTSPSQLYLRGASLTRVMEFIVADNTQNPGYCNAPPGSGIVVPAGGFQVASAGLVDLSQGTSDLMIDTLIVGKGFNGAGGGYSAGIFNMGAGTLDVNNLQLGVMSSAAGSTPVTGTFTVDPGGAVVANNQLALGRAFGGGVSAFAYGSLNVGGTLAAGTIVSGGASSIVVTNGTLSLTSVAGSIGTTAAPIGSVTLGNSTLNLAVGGPGAPVVTSNLTIVGASDTINVTEMPLVASVPSTVTLIQSLTPMSGAYDFVLGTLPTGYKATLQKSADATAVQLAVTAAPPFPTTGTRITAVSFQSATGALVITGANGLANGVYYVLTSTNAALPVTQWTLFGVSAFDSHGNFTLTLPYSPGDRERFYSIESQ
ncbi:MAG: beta strand repeat-containing protein [Limisphaerales bacterium]